MIDFDKLIVPKLYALCKELGFEQDSDETEAMRAAFVLGQDYMRDAAIEKLKTFDAGKCAQIVASVPLCNGLLTKSPSSGFAPKPLS